MVDRLIGTIGGAGWGVVVTLALPHQSMLSTGLALAVALVPLAAVVAVRPGYRIAPVTAAIVLLANSSPSGVVEAALERVLEIGLGSVVALAVALVVAPARAQDLLCAAGRDALALMADQVELLLGGGAGPPDLAAVAQALASFEAELAALRRDGVTRALAEEAVQRLFGLAFGLEQIGRNLDELAGRTRELAERR